MDHDKRLALLAFVIAAALHVTWWVGVPAVGMVRTGSDRDSGPVVSYVPTPVEDADMRMIRSPTVFSLPTPIGFSRNSLEQPLLTPPPVDIAAVPPAFRIRNGEMDPNEGRSAMQGRPVGVALTPIELARPVVPSPTFVRRGTETNAAIQLIWMDGLGANKSQAIPVEPGSIWDDEKPWEAIAVVVVDPEGSVNHIFIEKPTASAKRNLEFARLLRSLHVTPTGAAATGRLIARYNGRPSPPPSVLEKAAP